VGTLVLFAALASLRLWVARDLGLGFAQAWRLGLAAGLAYDALLALVPLLVSQLAWGLLRLPRAAVFGALALGAFLASGANVAYFAYFGGRLSGWAIRHHALDLLEIPGAASAVAQGPLWIAAGAVVVGGLLWLVAGRRRPRRRPSRARRLAEAWSGVGLALVVAFGLVALSTSRPRLGTALDDQIVFVWAKTAFDTRRQTALDLQQRDQLRRLLAADARAPSAAGATLASFRDHGRAAVPALDGRYPLLQRIDTPPAEVRALRRELGLPEDRAPNVVVLFLESVRALELRHPDLGPVVFPKLRALLAERAWDYRQAYSSAAGAGLTVRGQFSTLCSQLPNLRGPATYVARYDVRVRCLPEVARDNGYRTYWISSQDEGFHHKQLFEAVHGTDHFYDQAYFDGLGLQKNFDNCGTADGPFLQAYLALLEEIARDPRPFFVNTLTITTHVPHTVLPDVALPESLVARAPDERSLGYLTRLRYLDDALDAFFRAFFESELADDTVVVLLGDHGMKTHPAAALAPHQQMEMQSRVPLAIVTRDLRARVIESPVHQIDVAPTLARIAGLEGEATWLGRPIDGGAGSPWLLELAGSGLQYRVGDRACYRTPAFPDTRCFDVAGVDPLLEADLPEIAEDPAESARFGRVVDAQSQLIARDEIAPPSLPQRIAREDPL